MLYYLTIQPSFVVQKSGTVTTIIQVSNYNDKPKKYHYKKPSEDEASSRKAQEMFQEPLYLYQVMVVENLTLKLV